MRSHGFLILIGLFVATQVFSQGGNQIRVSGKITDGETGEVLPGASILIQGTAKGTVTGLDGDYTVLVPADGTILVYAYLGYVDQTVNVGDQRTIDIKLAPDITTLDEVVVTT